MEGAQQEQLKQVLPVVHFPVFRWSCLCFNLCPLPLILPLGTTKKSLAHSSSF